MAQLSAAAYIDAETSLAQRLNTLGFELVKEIGADDKEGGYICKCKDYAVLVFRGTHNKYEAILDLKVWHTHDDHVGYAEGFYAAYHKLLPQFVEFVDTAQIPVYITGHSLGGAISLITALCLQPYSYAACYTFGAPRVCSISGEKKDDGKAIFRVIHEDDIVPSMPLIIMGYWPFLGQMIYLTGKGITQGWQAYSMRILGQAWPIIQTSVFGLMSYIKNHFIDNYIEDLKKSNKV